jgi:large subunit ribosomal protein L24
MPQVYRAIRPMFRTAKWRIGRDDQVYILSGPDKGKTGRVMEIFKDARVPQVVVEGRNLVRRRERRVIRVRGRGWDPHRSLCHGPQRKKKVRIGADPDDFFVVTMEVGAGQATWAVVVWTRPSQHVLSPHCPSSPAALTSQQAPMHYSQVQLLDPQTGGPVRVIFAYTADGELVRLASDNLGPDTAAATVPQLLPPSLCGHEYVRAVARRSGAAKWPTPPQRTSCPHPLTRIQTREQAWVRRLKQLNTTRQHGCYL